MIPEGARCALHPDAGAIDVCTRCGDYVCARCSVSVDTRRWCRKCEAHAGDPFPWERREEIGYARALRETVRASIAGDFRRGFRDRSVVPALLYGACVCTTVRLAIVWGATLFDVSLVPAAFPPELAWFYSELGQLGWAAATPVVFVAAVVVLASGLWISFKAVGAPTRSFDQIVRCVAYVRGSIAPLEIPFAFLPSAIAAPALLAFFLLTIIVLARALAALTGASPLRVAGAFAVLAVALTATFLLIGVLVVAATLVS